MSLFSVYRYKTNEMHILRLSGLSGKQEYFKDMQFDSRQVNVG